MKSVNVHDGEYEYDPEDPPGYRAGAIRLAPALGGAALAVNAYEIPPGESLCPYHYEYDEEWLVVLEGAVAVRTPEEPAARLERGDAVCFPPGAAGAHKVGNPTGEPARILMFSSAREPSVAVYPDSDKIGVWPGDPADKVMLRRADGRVGYYDGET